MWHVVNFRLGAVTLAISFLVYVCWGWGENVILKRLMPEFIVPQSVETLESWVVGQILNSFAP